MSKAVINRWICAGLLTLPLYGLLTLWSSLDPQPDPSVKYEAWSRFVTTNHYVLGHLFGSIFGLVFAIFGTFALAAYLLTSRAGRLGLTAMVLVVLGSALFLPLQGISTFAAPAEGQAYLAGVEGFSELPASFADSVFAMTSLLVIVLQFVGNLFLGVAVWRSLMLPKLAGATWAIAHALMYLSLVYAVTMGPASTPLTVPVGAALLVVSGGWMALTALRRRPTGTAVGVHA